MRKIVVEINSKYPSYEEIHSHEMNRYDFAEVYFTLDGQPYDVDLEDQYYDLTANITVDNILIAQDQRFLPATDGNRKGALITLATTNAFTIPAGVLRFEFRIFNNTPGNMPGQVICPICPLTVKVHRSILDTAVVLPDSIGSIAQLINELPALNALLNRLSAAESNIVSNHDNIAAVHDSLSGKLDNSAGAVKETNIDDGAVTSTKIATGSIGMVHLESAAYDEINSKATVVNSTSVPIDLSTLNGYKNKKTMYKILLFSDVLYTGQPMALPATVWVTNNTQYIVTADGYIFTRDYNQGTDTWSTFSCPLRDLEARVTALEGAV